MYVKKWMLLVFSYLQGQDLVSDLDYSPASMRERGSR